MARIFAVANQKGGVGKTTVTLGLTRAAQTEGLKVLVVDMDPQGNLSSTLTAGELPEDQAGVADALSNRSPETLKSIITGTVWDRVSLAPTVGDVLTAVRDEITSIPTKREFRLRKALEEVRDEYDLVLIDCGPSLDVLTINAFTAADQVLIVTHAAQWSAAGLSRLLGTIEDIIEVYNTKLRIAGVLVNQYERNTLNMPEWLRDITVLAQQHEIPVLDPVIPRRIFIKDAAESSTGLDEWPNADAHKMHRIFVQHLKALTA